MVSPPKGHDSRNNPKYRIKKRAFPKAEKARDKSRPFFLGRHVYSPKGRPAVSGLFAAS
jgi:hypothetical protein